MAKPPYPPSHTHTHKHTHSPPLCSLSQSLSLSSHTHTHSLSPLLYTYIYTCMYVHTGTRIAKGAANVAYSLKGATKECTFELLLGKTKRQTMQSIWCGWKYQDMLFVVIRLLPLYCSTCCLSESLSFFVSLPPSLSFALSLLCVCVCDTVGVFVRTHTMQHPGGCLRG